jgi:hypothetical protein
MFEVTITLLVIYIVVRYFYRPALVRQPLSYHGEVIIAALESCFVLDRMLTGIYYGTEPVNADSMRVLTMRMIANGQRVYGLNLYQDLSEDLLSEIRDSPALRRGRREWKDIMARRELSAIIDSLQ